MSAVRDFPKHTNPAALRAGLVLQSKPKIEENEFGLLQTTLQFLTFNDNYPRLRPVRGTPIDQLKPGDDLTARILKAYNFLGAQTNGFTRNGSKPGIGLLEILCQGAIFAGNSKDIPGVITPAGEDDPITIPNNPISSTLDSVTVPVVIFGGTGVTITVLTGISAVVEYHAIDLHFEYMARDRAQRPRFLRDEYQYNTETGFLIIDDDGNEIELLIDSVATQITGNNTFEGVGILQTAKDWTKYASVRGTGSRFEQTPAGPFWHVLETATLKIVPDSDHPGDGAIIIGGSLGGDVKL